MTPSEGTDSSQPSKEPSSGSSCPSCHAIFDVSTLRSPQKKFPQYCPFCGTLLPPPIESSKDSSSSKSTLPDFSSLQSQVTLVSGHIPAEDPIQFTLGHYQILKSIGKGGMGEVFLAYDTSCGRRIALKRIRTDLSNHRQLYSRFIREARITSQLTHPSIIPIYDIHSEDHLIYYTMPFVEGETLKQILRKTRRQEKLGLKLDHLGGSIPALIRVFINICQAVAYAHSKNVMHRDLKPENIIIGKYGEVLILDWGLATLVKASGSETSDFNDPDFEEPETTPPDVTRQGRAVGTVSYMAPERALGHPATTQTDVYSLGVILYQILTLHLPFARKSLKDFLHSMHREKFIEPAEVAPYRDVPRILSEIVKRSVSPNLTHRYQTVVDLIQDLENYIEGRSEWFQVAELDIHHKEDWEFQENVLIAEHAAITRHTEVSDWVNLMISKVSVTGNTKMELQVKLGDRGHGLGVLLCIPEASEREHLNDGYCLWIGSEDYRGTRLLRSTVEVMNAQDTYLKRHEWSRVRIEKIETNIHFYLNDHLQFSYISHSPLAGTHIGLLVRDADFDIQNFIVYSAGQNITISCLAIPETFLANKNFSKALSEYRRIGYSFPGRAEGREALFLAGVTLLEQAKDEKENGKAQELYDFALSEFEKLHTTPGAPLEYLGKALVYEALKDYEEEIKCFELAYRRYPNHPLLPVLQEQIVYRMHESSHHHRLATYNFILLVVRHLPLVATSQPVKKLFHSLQKHWEPLDFMDEENEHQFSPYLQNLQFGIDLAFWLAKPYVLQEILQDLLKSDDSPKHLGNALFGLIELGSWKMAQQLIESLETASSQESLQRIKECLKILKITLVCHLQSPKEALHLFFSSIGPSLQKDEVRTLIYLMKYCIDTENGELLLNYEQQIQSLELAPPFRLLIDSQMIWALLSARQWKRAETLLHTYPLETLSKDSSLLHFLYGCWLYVSEGREIALAHLSGVLEVSYPRSWALFTHYLTGKITREQNWFKKAFLWERRQFYRQAKLFYHCSGDLGKMQDSDQLAKREYLSSH